MKKITAIATLASCVLASAHGSLVYTTFDIPSGSPNVGSFTIQQHRIGNANHLTQTNDDGYTYTFAYAYRYFTPSLTGTYALGMTDAPYDANMLLYAGQTTFPAGSPGTGLMELNDDGDWEENDGTFSYGTQIVNPGAADGNPDWMPLIEYQELSAGTSYLVAISAYRPFATTEPDGNIDGPGSIPLPAQFFVAGPGSVTLDGGGAAAVPEPGQVAASLLLLGGIGGYVFLKRRKAAQAATPAAA